ncbi:unnamed protein product [Leptosia nina]|uniref:Uncharacterized protein n=1 Tax=Leptosia nina TaxID=320188 RepID=A0AAV1K7E5_9NEOP
MLVTQGRDVNFMYVCKCGRRDAEICKDVKFRPGGSGYRHGAFCFSRAVDRASPCFDCGTILNKPAGQKYYDSVTSVRENSFCE